MRLDKKRLIPTETGIKLLDYLLGNFAPIFAYDYTARMENTLDEIAAGQRGELDVLQTFWGEFQPLLRGAAAEIRPPSLKWRNPNPRKQANHARSVGAI